jgi:hypothetical protein
VGAFGPVLRFTNGSFFHGAYIERPQVLQAADRTPIAFYTGFGRSAYEDCANWAQLFCVPGLDPSADCGPTLPPPPPPPKRVYPAQNGRCLVANASNFPCVGGYNDSCPLLLGDCGDATNQWASIAIPGGSTLSNLAPGYDGTSLNVDCDSCADGTIVKITNAAKYATAVAFSASGSGTLQFPQCPGKCLSGTTAEQRLKTCGPGTEWTVPQQLAVVDCSDASAGGWTW